MNTRLSYRLAVLLILVITGVVAGCGVKANSQDGYIREMYGWYEQWQSAESIEDMENLVTQLEQIGPPDEPIPVMMNDKLMYNVDASTYSDYLSVNIEYLEARRQVKDLENYLAGSGIEDNGSYSPLEQARSDLEAVEEQKLPIETRWLFMFMTYLPAKFA